MTLIEIKNRNDIRREFAADLKARFMEQEHLADDNSYGSTCFLLSHINSIIDETLTQQETQKQTNENY